MRLTIARAESVADDSNEDTSKHCTSCGHNTCTGIDPNSNLAIYGLFWDHICILIRTVRFQETCAALHSPLDQRKTKNLQHLGHQTNFAIRAIRQHKSGCILHHML